MKVDGVVLTRVSQHILHFLHLLLKRLLLLPQHFKTLQGGTMTHGGRWTLPSHLVRTTPLSPESLLYVSTVFHTVYSIVMSYPASPFHLLETDTLRKC